MTKLVLQLLVDDQWKSKPHITKRWYLLIELISLPASQASIEILFVKPLLPKIQTLQNLEE